MASTWKRLAGPADLTNAAATKYTVPASTKTVIRKMHFNNHDSVQHTVNVSIGADSAATRLLSGYPIAANQPYDLWGPITVDATEIIQAFADTGAVVSFEMDGQELTLG